MTATITTYEQALEFLYGRINYEKAQAGTYSTRDFKLDRMAELLDRLGNPHLTIPAVHIAGTKGKGTTSMFLAGILKSAGYQVGLFTSPHISAFEERLQIRGESPSRDEIVSLAKRVARVAEDMDREPMPMPPTFFELTMAMAWVWFRDQNAEIVVLEVGLGGRLDATNLCRPAACAITSISRDHTGLLGSTLAEIAGEKAGIIKPNVPVVSGVDPQEADEVISKICGEQNAQLWKLGQEIVLSEETDSSQFTLQTPARKHAGLSIGLSGGHQRRNAALATGLADLLQAAGWKISEAAVRSGLSGTTCPLRIEKVQESPTVILDVAHNWASARALVQTLERDEPSRRKILIFAASRDKDVTGILRVLLPRFETVVVTQFLGNPRAVGVSRLVEIVTNLTGQRPHATETPCQAWKLAQTLATRDDVICGTGSFFIAAELKELLLQEASFDPADSPRALT